MTEKKQGVNQEFVKGIAIGVLVVLSLAFVVQNIAGIELGSGSKVIKKTIPTTDTAPAEPTQAAPDPTAAPVAIADITTDDHLYGDPNAPITLVEYSDLECPFCGRFHPTAQQVVDDNAGEVNWVYRHFPLRSIHNDAQKLAEAAECVADRGGEDAFWDFVDYVFKNGTKVATVNSAATAVGLDGADITSCMNSGEKEAIVNAQYDDAVNSGGRGTPYTIVIGADGASIPLSGAVPASQIQGAIDSLK